MPETMRDQEEAEAAAWALLRLRHGDDLIIVPTPTTVPPAPATPRVARAPVRVAVTSSNGVGGEPRRGPSRPPRRARGM